jgi:hypothetical protein
MSRVRKRSYILSRIRNNSDTQTVVTLDLWRADTKRQPFCSQRRPLDLSSIVVKKILRVMKMMLEVMESVYRIDP